MTAYEVEVTGSVYYCGLCNVQGEGWFMDHAASSPEHMELAAAREKERSRLTIKRSIPFTSELGGGAKEGAIK